MAGSSPTPRRSTHWSSPEGHRISDFLSDNRNNELSHKDALEAAQVEHNRVRQAAIRVYKIHELQEENRRLQEQQIKLQQEQKVEEERLRREQHLRDEELRLRALKAKEVPQLPPEPEPPKPIPVAAESKVKSAIGDSVQKPTAANATDASSATSLVKPSPFAPQEAKNKDLQQPPPAKGPFGDFTNAQRAPSPASQPAQQTNAPLAPSPFQQKTSASPFSTLKPAQPQLNGTSPQATQVAASAAPDRYVEIHRNLKKLRASMVQQAKAMPPLKARMGDMRRDLRKCIGQLTGGKGANTQQLVTIKTILKEALDGRVPSAPVDPNDYVLEPREPVEGALHNEPQLPSLFVFLLNHLSKAIINQFINECGAQPRTADPIGVVTAQVFSMKDYLWRGKTLIDILMAKFRVACPVVFGYRGNDKTQQGRQQLGWIKDGAGYILEQQHNDRMMGLGAGFAAISLRDFSRSSNTNPWPPSKYWTSMAQIVNSPGPEISNTQAVVLKSMIEHYEDKFINFYGTAGIAALRKALVEFPTKAVNKTPGVNALQVLAQILKRDVGLDLQ